VHTCHPLKSPRTRPLGQQVLVLEMLRAWGEEGLHAHLCRLQREYAEKAAAVHAAAVEELRGLAEWHPPRAGMFMVGGVLAWARTHERMRL
jgi:DNA-binding transcriptional MocR family regulator